MRLDSIGTLFGNAWRRMQERFAVVVWIFFLPLVLMGISQLLFWEQKPAAVILGAVIYVISIIVSMLASIALILALGKGTDFAASYEGSIKFFWSWIWIAILVWLATMGGFFMLIVPGIILAAQLTLSSYVLVLEGRHGIAALAQSREYIKGYWWAFVGRTLLLTLCLFAAFLILFWPATLILGPIVGGIVYGILLLFFTPFAVSYQYEIYENLRRLKPEVADSSEKAEQGFLKVSMVVGIVGAALLFVLICAAAVFLPAALLRFHVQQPNAWDGYPMEGTSTMQLSPTSGPVGSMVAISGPVTFDATNTIFMNGLVAAKNVAPSADGTLSFKVPATLAPDCKPNEMCAQFLIEMTPGTSYGVAVENSQGLVSAGTFTIATSSAAAPVKLN